MLRNLKIASSIAVGILLVTSGPSWAGRTAYVPVVVKVSPFVLPSFSSEKLELSGLSESTPYGKTIDLNSRITPIGDPFSLAKFQVSGKHCSIRDGILRASEPTDCTVIAARAAGPFSSIETSAPTVFTFGAYQSSLKISIDTNTATGLIKGQSVTLRVTGGSGSGSVHFDSQPGDICLSSSGVATNIGKPACTILINKTGSACSVVGNILTATSSTLCRVTATKDGDTTFLPITSDQIGIKFGAGLGDQPEIISIVPAKPPVIVPIVKSTLVISNDPTYSSVGIPITLTTVGGKGGGTVTYAEISSNPTCVIVGNQLVRATFGTCRIRATKAADAAFASQISQVIDFTFYGSKVQDPLVIDSRAPISRVGVPINLSTTGGSSAGVVSYVITGGTGTGTITGTVLSATSAGTFTIVATKQGDTVYASVVSDPVTFTFTV